MKYGEKMNVITRVVKGELAKSYKHQETMVNRFGLEEQIISHHSFLFAGIYLKQPGLHATGVPNQKPARETIPIIPTKRTKRRWILSSLFEVVRILSLLHMIFNRM